MGVTDPDADPWHRQSMILVPMDAPGVTVEQDLPVYGYVHRGGHGVVDFEDVRVPATNLLGEEGSGFAIAPPRLGPAPNPPGHREHPMADRAFDRKSERVLARRAWDQTPADHGATHDGIA